MCVWRFDTDGFYLGNAACTQPVSIAVSPPTLTKNIKTPSQSIIDSSQQRLANSFRVLKWWRHKNLICKITNLVVIFRKSEMKNATMPKFSILPSISDEILPRLCSDDPWYNSFLNWRGSYGMNQAIFKRICRESLKHNFNNISPTFSTNVLIFGKDRILFLVLIARMISANISHKFAN